MTEMVNLKLNKRWDIIVPKHRAERPEYNKRDGWEGKRLLKLEKAIKTLGKPTVYYVGTEEGEMAALCQMWGAEVVLFEPNPKVWPNIKAIWQSNKLETPLQFEGFASNKSTHLHVKHTPSVWVKSAESQVIGNHGFKELYLEADNYPQIKIDDVWKNNPILAPDIISLDVEGSEWRVLEGAEETIRGFKPKIFLSGHPEFMFNQWGEYLNDLRGWIKSFEYKEELLAYDHEVHLYYEAV